MSGNIKSLTNILKTDSPESLEYLKNLTLNGDLNNYQFETENTILHYYMYYGNIKLFSKALELGALTVSPIYNGFLDAIQQNKPEFIDIILSKSQNLNINNVDANGDTPLMNAVLFNRINIVEKLTSYGKVEYKTYDRNGDSPLHIACRYNNITIISILKNNGCPSSIFNIFTNDTPLHIACAESNIEAVRYLMNFKDIVSSIKKKNVQGFTPADLAAGPNKTYIELALISRELYPPKINGNNNNNNNDNNNGNNNRNKSNNPDNVNNNQIGEKFKKTCSKVINGHNLTENDVRNLRNLKNRDKKYNNMNDKQICEDISKKNNNNNSNKSNNPNNNNNNNGNKSNNNNNNNGNKTNNNNNGNKSNNPNNNKKYKVDKKYVNTCYNSFNGKDFTNEDFSNVKELRKMFVELKHMDGKDLCKTIIGKK